MATATWHLSVDTGGTFTDCVARDPDGRRHTAKVLSTSALRGEIVERLDPFRLRIRERWRAPGDFPAGFSFRLLGVDHPPLTVTGYQPDSAVLTVTPGCELTLAEAQPFELRSSEPAPLLAARLATATPAGAPLPPVHLRLATTLGTNALLQRAGARTALFLTRGFGDLLLIGTQQRPDLFALAVRKSEPLASICLEVAGRLDSHGVELEGLGLDDLAETIDQLVAAGTTTAAVALLNSHRNPEHERRLAAHLLARGFSHVSCSSQLAPSIQILPRAETALANAYLTPIVGGYLDRLTAALDGGDLHVMTSAGGLIGRPFYEAKQSLLSGPAGGVAGIAQAARRSGLSRVIGFDMGGTSTDVSRYDGAFEYVFEHEVAGVRLLGPALAIETVAAGGGSICWFDTDRLRVGPLSAGAQPGPAAYAAGGPLTVTDVNLLLGRLDPDAFDIPIQPAAATARLEELRALVTSATSTPVTADELLPGLLDIVDESMAGAIRKVSIERGYDPAEYTLVGFGGAGGQHATAVARRLGITRILIPADAGLLSAIGVEGSLIERFAEHQVLRPLSAVLGSLPTMIRDLEEAAISAIRDEGIDDSSIVIRRRLAHLRFNGQEASLAVDVAPGDSPEASFREQYFATFGYLPTGRPVELESLRVVASQAEESAAVAHPEPAAHPSEPPVRRRAWMAGGWHDAGIFERATLAPGARLVGPALVVEAHSATVVEPGWELRVDGAAALVLEQRNTWAAALAEAPVEAVRLELFASRFRAIAEQMGAMLQKTALSTNIKERLDFSCALLDAEGELLVNAPHIPVHLGSLGPCVQKLRESVLMGPGDVIVTNHPAYGGSHLPDVTAVAPVHAQSGNIIGYVASRAHHAEIGGIRPGSMPPRATRLVEEGVVIPPTHVRQGKRIDWDELQALLATAPHPSRAVADNLADVQAAVAANLHGVDALRALADRHGEYELKRYMTALNDRAEERMRLRLGELAWGVREATEFLDDGTPIRVRIAIKDHHAKVDFAGSGPVHAGNLNATPAIVRSAVLYVFRLLVDETLPLNGGLMRAIDLAIPRGLLNPPFPDDPAKCPAIVGGNVETSQRVVDTLLKALGIVACSQGTMNNVLFGNDRFGYYETIGGGCGAGPDFPGADAVHSHMTNTRITDPELIEHRYPVRVERFAIRRGSGGAGRHRGGDGIIREITFLQPASLSVLTQHRGAGPYGVAGGSPGKPGSQRVVRASGEVVELMAIDQREVEAGDRLIIETPGGGGYGVPETVPPPTVAPRPALPSP